MSMGKFTAGFSIASVVAFLAYTVIDKKLNISGRIAAMIPA